MNTQQPSMTSYARTGTQEAKCRLQKTARQPACQLSEVGVWPRGWQSREVVPNGAVQGLCLHHTQCPSKRTLGAHVNLLRLKVTAQFPGHGDVTELSG